MTNQSPQSILMIRPAAFGYNAQTAASNAFQFSPDIDVDLIHQKALEEFDHMVKTLRLKDITIHVVDDSESPTTPDAIFPNNWFSTHHNGEIVLYPMEAENRRLERRTDVIDLLRDKYVIDSETDLSKYEQQGKYLEGTGSIVFDHSGKKAYACKSSRTDEILLIDLCDQLNYTPVVFGAVDKNGDPIYHTNVMMCVATDFTIVCLESIADEDQENVINHLQMGDRQLIAIGYEQMNAFAGNMLEVENENQERFLVMSQQAFQSLVNGQINAITQSVDIISVEIPTIEQYGGGGVRCMMAGIHLPKK
jgi:hypothetical protein